MKNRLFTPAHQPLLTPAGDRRVLRRPDLRNLVTPRLSGSTLGNEVDFDDLVVHRSWRSYDSQRPDEVRYFMFELSQRNPGETVFSPIWYKAVRMIRLTRVPRYLRQASSATGPNMVFEQMRDVLAALRENGVLFTNMIAKSPNLPLVFAYGVQGVGSTPEQAQRMADEAFAVLEFQLSGTYQQLMYKPITVAEGELLARYQTEWRHLAVGRGRPIPASSTLGSSSLLDGNRTDIEGAQNQLESFIRGMADKSFVLNLVTVPLSPAEITVAWRNLTQKLTELRSETTGARAVNAGVSFPLVMGTSQGDSHGNTHTSGASYGTSTNDGTSSSVAQGITNTEGSTGTVGSTQTQGVSQSAAQGHSTSITDSYQVGQNSSVSTSETHGISTTQGVSSTNTVGESSSTAVGSTVGQNWNNSIGQSLQSSVTSSDSWSQSQANSSSQTVSAGNTRGDSSSAGSTSQTGSNVGGGIPGVANGGTNTASGSSLTNGTTNSNTVGLSQTGGSSNTVGVSSSNSQSVSQGVNMSESYGGSTSTSATQTNSVNQSQALGVSQSVASSHSSSASQSSGVSASQGQSLARGESLTNTVGTNSSAAQSQSMAKSASTAQSVTGTDGTSRSIGTNQAYNDAYAIAMSRTNTSSGSLAVAPSFGVSVSKNTFDAAKQYIGDLLEAQQRRYDEGIKSGAFLYQMFLVCPDRETLMGGAGLLKSAFWGAGNSADKLPQPFHTVVDFDDAERERLLVHAAAFTSYRKRESVTELIEPFKYSTYLTPTEAAAFTHPPVVEGPGMLAVHDSMPVFRIPADRQDREIRIGHVVNGERGLVSDIRFGLDLSDLTHTLIAGVTGSGKTTTLMKLLTDAVKIEREIVEPPTMERPYPVSRTAHVSILGLDWMRNMRNLASIPGLAASGRFRFYSLLNPELGAFRWNPLEIPAIGMSPNEWLNAQADNFTASFNLGEFGRSLIAEFLTELYQANRLVEYTLRPATIDPMTGMVLRPAITLPAIPREQLPAHAIQVNASGEEVANVMTFPELSRCVSMAHLATIVANKIEEAADVNKARLLGTAMRDRLQSLWRRMAYFAPGGQYSELLACDADLSTRSCLGVTDLIDPDRGLVTVLETDGLDFEARRLILGSVMLAIYRYGLFHGNGVFDHNGRGPGCFVVMEESHELFGESGRNEDAYSAATRTHLYESMFRRVRALGLRLVAVAQQPSTLPDAVTANVNTVVVHKVRAESDRKKAFDLLNMSNQVAQQQREYRYLGEMATGFSLVRLDAKDDYTESAPVHVRTEPPLLSEVTDAELRALAQYHGTAR